MNNVLISAEEVAALNESLRLEIGYIRMQFEGIYDIKEQFSSTNEEQSVFSKDRKIMRETCEIFQCFTEFTKTVCTEYKKCEEVICETVEAIRL